MARLGLSEILKLTSEQPEDQRGEFIRKNWNPTLGQLIRCAYDASYEWDLPEGVPPYKPNEYLDQESNLYTEARRLYVFMKGSGDHISQRKKEELFIGLLENLSREDAELLVMIKDHQLPYGITLEFVQAELPGWIQSPREVKPADDVITFPAEATTTESVVEVADPAPKPVRKVTKRKTTTRKTTAKKPVAKKVKKADK